MTTPLRQYSTLFHTIHDEEDFSVIRFVAGNNKGENVVRDIAIIWDEDRDERVIRVIEQLLVAGKLVDVLAIGEHEGSLTLYNAKGHKVPEGTDTAIADIIDGFALGDYWNVYIEERDDVIGTDKKFQLGTHSRPVKKWADGECLEQGTLLHAALLAPLDLETLRVLSLICAERLNQGDYHKGRNALFNYLEGAFADPSIPIWDWLKQTDPRPRI